MQQQESDTCGLFAVSSALALALGNNPSTFSLNESIAHADLIQCFENNRLIPFPKTSGPIQLVQTKTEVFDIFCSCRMIKFQKVHGYYAKRDLKFVDCSKCKENFHPKCKKIRAKYLESDFPYYCSRKCLKDI